MKDYDIDSLINKIDFNSGSFNDIGNGIMLTNREIEVLDKYQISYKNRSLKEIIFDIEEILNESEIVFEDLDDISKTISERDYYENTNK